MKIKYSILSFIWIFIVVIVGCKKEIQEPVISAYVPADLDIKGGTWKTYVLPTNDAITIVQPLAPTSAEYLAELAALKNAIGNVTEDQKSAVAYWSAGAVYRWNEIARELAAKYNLPPAAKADGTYPIPDAANPLADPKFPFANPPYTSRALAYLSVAQYDALVSTWYYKYKFNSVAPSKNDNSIKPLLGVTDLPTYPSEDAVVAAASYFVLSKMFPGELPYLKSKLDEAKNARIWGGMNVNSELAAGDSLGTGVAKKIMAKASSDNMSTANNQTLNAGKIANALSLGIKENWVSQELPARPPMLPNFGAVKTWNYDSTTKVNIRPAIPYIVGSAEFNKDLDELKNIQSNQTREQARIANFWADGAGSYTPPGHWHRTAVKLCYENKYSELRTARTLALMATALMDAGVSCWDTKYYYYTSRPQQFGVKTTVGLPNFPSFTSGHSTFSAAAASVLGYVFPNKAAEMDALANEASESRINGLIHYRVDCEMGLVHGKKIGNYAVLRGKADGSGL
jgi:PAP2 superfamily